MVAFTLTFTKRLQYRKRDKSLFVYCKRLIWQSIGCSPIYSIPTGFQKIAKKDMTEEGSPKTLSRPISTSTMNAVSGQLSQTSAQRAGLGNPSMTILPTDKFTESDVEEIVALGFTREQAIVELRRFNGDKTHATVALFAKSLKF